MQFPLLQHHSHFNHLKDKLYAQLRTLQWLSSKESDCNTGDARDASSGILDGEDPLEEKMATHSSILAWKIHGQRSLVGYSPWGCKESDTTYRLNNNSNTYILSLLGLPPIPTSIPPSRSSQSPELGFLCYITASHYLVWFYFFVV